MKKDVLLEAVYVLNDTDGITEIKVVANSIEQINGWVLAMWDDKVVGGVKEEYLKAFYLNLSFKNKLLRGNDI